MSCNKPISCIVRNIAIFIDTNVLDQVNRWICYKMFKLKEFSGGDEKDAFLKHLSSVFKVMNNCTGMRMFTAEPILREEMDVRRMSSSLITQSDVEDFKRLCSYPSFADNVYKIYKSNIKGCPDIVSFLEKDLEQIIDISKLSPKDRTLLLLALEFSQKDDVILVSDELNLGEAIKEINSRKGETLPVSKYVVTGRLIHHFPNEYFRFRFLCCEIERESWWNFFSSYVDHNLERYRKTRCMIKVCDRHQQQMGDLIKNLVKDQATKIENDNIIDSAEAFLK